MTIPIGACVRHAGRLGAIGRTCRGPHRAARDYQWVHWDGEAEPSHTYTACLVYVSRRYADGKAWDQALAEGRVYKKPA